VSKIKINSLLKRKTKQCEKLRVLESMLADIMRDKLKSVEFIKCNSCKSHMDTRFRSRTLKCPICASSLLSKTNLKRIEIIRLNIDDIDKQLKVLAKQTAKTFNQSAVIDAIKSLDICANFNYAETENRNGQIETELAFRSHDEPFYNSGSIEDNDHPDFIGESIISNLLIKLFKKSYITICNHEKGHFSVIMSGVPE